MPAGTFLHRDVAASHSYLVPEQQRSVRLHATSTPGLQAARSTGPDTHTPPASELASGAASNEASTGGLASTEASNGGPASIGGGPASGSGGPPSPGGTRPAEAAGEVEA